MLKLIATLLHEDMQAEVCNGGESFRVRNGLHHGCTLLSTPFSLNFSAVVSTNMKD